MRIVVVATGTGVGKTHVASSLVLALRAAGRAAVGLKPVETGVDPVAGTPPDSDQGRLDAAAAWRRSGDDAAGEGGELFHVKQDADTSYAPPHAPRAPGTAPGTAPPPYRFERPVSPHLAARDSGVAIELGRIRAWVESCAAPDVVIETAGGLFSPIGPSVTNFDLARSLEPSRWILVAPDRLGVLHDVTAAVGLARALGRAPDAVVLSTPAPRDTSAGTNGPELERLGIATVAAVFPPSDPNAPEALDAARAALAALAPHS